jgi:hypothetical protein
MNCALRRNVTASRSSPSTAVPPGNRCNAILEDGKECLRTPPFPGMPRCRSCHQDYRRLHEQYKVADIEYSGLVRPADGFDTEARNRKIELGEEVIRLRDEVHKRFFSDGGGSRGHIIWILQVRNEVRQLQREGDGAHLALAQDAGTSTIGESIPVELSVMEAGVGELNLETSPPMPPDEEETKERPKVYQSLLNPSVPIEALSHLPADSPVRVLRQSIISFREGLIRRIYDFAPSLDDSDSGRLPKQEGNSRPDDGDHVMRFVFRELVVWKGDVETVACATKMQSIDTFLKSRDGEELEWYIKFLGHLTGARRDTWHFLRNAIADFLLPPNAPAITILGGRVATEDSDRAISLEGWDILYQYFGNIVSWYNLSCFCTRIDELLLVNGMLALGRWEEWLDREKDVAQESPGAVFLGFIPYMKGYTDNDEPGVTKKTCRGR